jgi:uncharacterized protein
MMSKLTNPFIKRFKTGNHLYVYDVNTNRILRVNEAMYEIIEELNEFHSEHFVNKLQGKFPGRDVISAYQTVSKLQTENGLFSYHRPEKMGHGYCDKHFNRYLDNCIQQLTLEITTSCNMRCRYCAFSGKYNYAREHGNQWMSKDTAKKAIDYYIRHSRESERHSVGFYGGEPLLYMGLIKYCISYVKKVMKNKDVHINMTTNGTLLKGDTAKYLIDNDVSLLISIDGNREVHNRHRVFPDNSGSFDIVYNNLKNLRKMNRDYYDKNISVACVLSDECGVMEPFKFFSSHKDRSLWGLFVQVSSINSVNLKEEYSYLRKGQQKFDRTTEYRMLYDLYLRRLIDNQSEGKENDFLRSLFQRPFLTLYKREESPMGESIKINGMCVPGWRKLFVDTEGKFYTCERVNRSMPIGDVDNGIDKEVVQRILDLQVSANKDRCISCWAVRLCGLCLSSINGDACIDLSLRDEYCEAEKKRWEATLSDYCTVLENNPTAFDFMEKIVVM